MYNEIKHDFTENNPGPASFVRNWALNGFGKEIY